MNKKIGNSLITVIIVLLMIIPLHTEMAMAQEDKVDNTKTYIVYDCVTGEESEMVVESGANSEIEEHYGQYEEELSDTAYDSIQGNASRIIIPGGELERVDVTKSPYSKILCLKLGIDYDGDGDTDDWSYGTGFMVYLDIMLTAGHNIYTPNYGRIVEMQIYVYQQGETLKDAYITPLKYSVSPELVKGNYDQYDWAVVILPQELGRTTGWFQYATAEAGMQTYVTVSGYPYKEGYSHYQYESIGLFQRYNPYYFRHKCSTLDGMSGAPAYDSDGVVWGIHTKYDEDDKSYNGGMLIAPDLCDLIDSWK